MQSAGVLSNDEDSIKVYVRIRPVSNKEQDLDFGNCLETNGNTSIIVHTKPESKVFTFDHVADCNTTQESVFMSVGKTIIESCVAGYNGTIFAYGQTGSGKTFTMLGPSENSDNFHHKLRGIIPRTFEYLFLLINREKEKHGQNKEFLCRCSFLEIYNEQIYDLLDPTCAGLHVRENIKRGVFVDGLTEQVVHTANEAYDVLYCGWTNRHVASTSMNRESSRSHAVFSLSIESKEKKIGIQNIRISQLNLVDLAGSERQKDTNTDGARLKEASSINKSLSALGNVMLALVKATQGRKCFVPYRNSKLTFLLRDSLGGNAKTQIIANVHPGIKCFGETLSTLQFARRAKLIKNKAIINEDTLGNVVHLQEEIKQLKELINQLQSNSLTKDSTLLNHSCFNTPAKERINLSVSPEWKIKFIDAMLLREKSESEKKVLLDKIVKLEDLCNKKENFIQSSKMIIKFKESHISRLKRTALSEENKLDKTDKDAYIDELRSEITVLQKQLEHHPCVAKFAMENQNLRSELKKLYSKEALSHQHFELEKAEQLEKIFQELMKDKQRCETKIPAIGTSPVPVTIVEKLKSQIANLQTELESAKQEIQEEKELSKKIKLELESELTSCKKSNEEIEKILASQHMKNKCAMTAINDIHLNTIKIMTTPTKTSRVVTATINEEGIPLNFELEDVEGNIFDETIPQEFNDALTEEVKQLQNINNDLTEQIQNKETKILHYKATIMKLDHQVSELNNLIASERSEWCKKENELSHQIKKLDNLMDQMAEDSRVYKSEAEDLRVLLQSADRELYQTKQDGAEKHDEHNKGLIALQTRVICLESDIEKFSKEKDSLTEEKEYLETTIENLDEQVKFQEGIIRDLKHNLNINRQQTKDLEAEVQAAMEKLDLEYEKTAKLEMQIQEEDKEQQQLLLKALQDNISLKTRASELESFCEEKSKKIMHLTNEYENTMEVNKSLEKQINQQKGAITELLSKINCQKATINEQDVMIANMRSDQEDNRTSYEILLAANEEQKLQLEEFQQSREVMKNSLDQLTSKHEIEMSVVKDEFETMTENYGKLTNEMKNLQNLFESSQNEAELYLQEIRHLKDELANKKLDLESLQQEFNQLQNDNKPTSSQVEQDISEPNNLAQILAFREQEIVTYKNNQEQLTRFLDEYEASRKEKNEQIQLLRAQLVEAIHFKTEVETWQTRCRSLEYRLEELDTLGKEKEIMLSTTIKELREKLETTQLSCRKTAVFFEKSLQEKHNLELELSQMTSDLESTQISNKYMSEELDRLRTMESQYCDEKEKLSTQLEQVLQERAQIAKENEWFAEENIRLVGHNNPKQRIHYLSAIKKENDTLREQVAILKAEKLSML